MRFYYVCNRIGKKLYRGERLSNSEKESGELSKGLVSYLLVTAITCGALIMVIEVMGSRVIGPFFGASLFVWTSLISVTMIALAAGYGLGGLMSDRWSKPDNLYYLIMLAGIFTLAVPHIKTIVIKLCIPLGLRGGAFTSSIIMFGPPLFLLGCVSPYMVKIAAKRIHNVGRVVGGLYSLSTFGSIIGTIVTGFVLIAYIGVNNIFSLTGFLLIGLSAGYFMIFRKKFLIAIILILPYFMIHSDVAVSRTLKDGTQVTEIYKTDSFYGNLKVVDYKHRKKHIRELIIDGLVQGGVDVRNGLSFYGYSYLMQFIPYLLHPEGKSCLVIGLGAGVIPKWYTGMGIMTDVVDIDPEVVDIATRFFDFKTKGQVFISDARYHLLKSNKVYDFISLDVFSGDVTPGHLLSLEALQLVRKRMSEEGVLSINLMGDIKEDTYMTASIVKTLKEVFDQVDIYPSFNIYEGDGSGNIIIVAYPGSKRSLNLSMLRDFEVHRTKANLVRVLISKPFRFEKGTKAIILTDDYNPIDVYDLPLREKVRMDIIHATEWDVLMGST